MIHMPNIQSLITLVLFCFNSNKLIATLKIFHQFFLLWFWIQTQVCSYPRTRRVTYVLKGTVLFTLHSLHCYLEQGNQKRKGNPRLVRVSCRCNLMTRDMQNFPLCSPNILNSIVNILQGLWCSLRQFFNSLLKMRVLVYMVTESGSRTGAITFQSSSQRLQHSDPQSNNELYTYGSLTTTVFSYGKLPSTSNQLCCGDYTLISPCFIIYCQGESISTNPYVLANPKVRYRYLKSLRYNQFKLRGFL